MTMPDERARAIGWGHALLYELARDEAVLAAQRSLASQLLAAYPSRERLKAVIASGQPLSADELRALADAWALFKTLDGSDAGSQSTRRSVRFTLRHHPDPMTVNLMGGPPDMAPPTLWLQAPREWTRPE